ncbi:MAG: maltokinase N-terminal cap-like domain-containing protein [Nocardioidaceae bacterium]
MKAAYHEQLTAYLATQRWFAGKDRGFEVVHVHDLPWLASEAMNVRVEVVTVEFADGQRDDYQFLATYQEELDPARAHALVGEIEHPELGLVAVYDAVYYRDAASLFLQAFLDQVDRGDMSFVVLESAELPDEAMPGNVMSAEQSNTSIAYGEQAILKLYRRLSEGGNPDIEIHQLLTLHGSEHVAPLLGWVEAQWSDVDGVNKRGHLGMLQAFLRTATDGWDIALSSVRDLLVEEDLHPDEVGGDFASEAERLGAATAEVHLDLATLLETATLTSAQTAALVAAMIRRLEAAIEVVPEIAPYGGALRAHFNQISSLTSPLHVQRIHGDLHLGQTLRTVKGWKIIDFEGEPAKSLAERVALDSPFRDVAGMLRSFDYAAAVTLRQFGEADHLLYHADEWTARNRKAFLEGYASIGADDDPAIGLLLRAYEADKAVYEAVYEARNRPAWVPIPVRAIARIAADKETS